MAQKQQNSLKMRINTCKMELWDFAHHMAIWCSKIENPKITGKKILKSLTDQKLMGFGGGTNFEI